MSPYFKIIFFMKINSFPLVMKPMMNLIFIENLRVGSFTQFSLYLRFHVETLNDAA